MDQYKKVREGSSGYNKSKIYNTYDRPDNLSLKIALIEVGGALV